MAATSRFSTHHVPDDGIGYRPGEIVRVDRSSSQVKIVKDPAGDHEVHSCRQATEYTGGMPLLRVGLKRTIPEPIHAPAEPSGLPMPDPQVRWQDRS
jgi:hypothetical protein